MLKRSSLKDAVQVSEMFTVVELQNLLHQKDTKKHMALVDMPLKVGELAKTVDITTESIYILTQDLPMKISRRGGYRIC